MSSDVNVRVQPAYAVEGPAVLTKQGRLLTEPLRSSWSGPSRSGAGEPPRFVVLADVGLSSSPDEPALVPGVMLSLGVTVPEDVSQKEGWSYVVSRLGKPPEVVLEIVSSREGEELGERLRRYQEMRVPHYVVYDPRRELGGPSLRAFELRSGVYVAVERPWFEGVGLGLVEWEGIFEDESGPWLRWCTRDGRMVLTEAEQAQTAEMSGESAEVRIQRLAALLRERGIEPSGEG